MTRVHAWEWDELFFDDAFPENPSDDLLRGTLFAAEAWCGDVDAVVTYWDILRWFDGWDQDGVDEEERYATVGDYIRDCIGQGLHPLKSAPDYRWRADYAFRSARGQYYEDSTWVRVADLVNAFNAAQVKLDREKADSDWSGYRIYNIGIMGDPEMEII